MIVRYNGHLRLLGVIQNSRSVKNVVASKQIFLAHKAASQLTDVRRYSDTSAAIANLEVHSRYGYDGAGRISRITLAKTEIAAGQIWNGNSTLPASLTASTFIAGYALGYDRDNRIASSANFVVSLNTTYTHRSDDQLTGASSAAIPELAAPVYTPPAEAYTLDNADNRLLAGNGATFDQRHA